MEKDVQSKDKNDLSKHRAQEYLIEHPILHSDDKQKKILENVFIDAFSKGYQCGFDDLANLLNAMWSSEPVKPE